MTLGDILRRAAEAHRGLVWSETPTPEQAKLIRAERIARRRALDEKTYTILQEYKKQAKEGREKKAKGEKSGSEIAANTVPAPPASIEDADSGGGAQARPGAARRVYALIAVVALTAAALIGVKR